MTNDYNIFRPATSDERRDFLELKEGGSRDLLDTFMASLAAKQQEYQKQYLPFDAYSARIDFEENIRKAYGEMTTVIGSQNQVAMPKVNLEEYADAKRFELLEVLPVMEDKLLDGIRNSVQIGKNFRFKAKIRGNGITIFVPTLDLQEAEKRISDLFSKEAKKVDTKQSVK